MEPAIEVVPPSKNRRSLFVAVWLVVLAGGVSVFSLLIRPSDPIHPAVRNSYIASLLFESAAFPKESLSFNLFPADDEMIAKRDRLIATSKLLGNYTTEAEVRKKYRYSIEAESTTYVLLKRTPRSFNARVFPKSYEHYPRYELWVLVGDRWLTSGYTEEQGMDFLKFWLPFTEKEIRKIEEAKKSKPKGTVNPSTSETLTVGSGFVLDYQRQVCRTSVTHIQRTANL